MSLLGEFALAAASILSQAGSDRQVSFDAFSLTLTNDSPETILLADMIGTSTERFFSADRKSTCIH